MANRGSYDWTEDRIAQLRTLWDDPANSVADIARIMDATTGSVCGKAHRLHLEPRPSPIKRGAVPGERQRDRPHRKVSTLLPLASVPDRPFNPLALTPSAAAIAPPPVLAEPPAPRRARSKCCWPIGEPRERGFRYCEAPCAGSYCDEHAAMAYAPRGSVKPAKLVLG